MSIDLSFLKAAIPTIASALGGPFAGLAAGFIASKLGLEDKTVDSISGLISGASPEDMVKIKEIDADLKKYFAGLGLKETELENADRNSARQREMTVQDWTPRILSYLITLGFFGVVAYLIRYGKPEFGSDVLLVLVGSLGTAWTGIISYYFGSSKGSEEKTRLLSVK